MPRVAAPPRRLRRPVRVPRKRRFPLSYCYRGQRPLIRLFGSGVVGPYSCMMDKCQLRIVDMVLLLKRACA